MSDFRAFAQNPLPEIESPDPVEYNFDGFFRGLAQLRLKPGEYASTRAPRFFSASAKKSRPRAINKSHPARPIAKSACKT